MLTETSGAQTRRGGPFDHYARLVRRFLDVPVALVTLVEPDRQVFPGMVGMPGAVAQSRETPLSHSFCQYVVMDEQPLVITDARLDPRLATNPAIRDLDVVAYAGWPLVDAGGRTRGSLCAIDSVPRAWTADELDILRDLAAACSSELQTTLLHARGTRDLARTVLESVGVGMVVLDIGERVLIANSLASSLCAAAGFALDEPPYAGLDVRCADGSEKVPPEEQVIPRSLRGDLEQREMEWFGPPGQQVAVLGSSRALTNADGTRWGTLVALQDVTELARSVQVKDAFISTVSHELRTPLTAILSWLELVAVEPLPEGSMIGQALTTIDRQARHLRERVQLMLDTADRRRRLQLECTDVCSLVARVERTFAEQVRAAGLELVVEPCGTTFATVDARLVEQAVENLVSNAVKYSTTGGRIGIAVHVRDEAVDLAVTDNGLGMTPDEVSQACDTFWRSERAQASATQGLGIGLSLVRNIVEAHDGLIAVRSELGQGTTVTLSFPR